ncbi:MAG: threonylcarbamoyl-AMP synthase [Erysipelotrichaceae bacterium]|nr:threonylcarbamoyl-AMP synthase [Erysipelotrichaceae bacterium]
MKKYSAGSLDEAAAALCNHDILLIPTDTVYGVGVIYGSLEDLERLKQIKHRPETKPIPLMGSSIEMLEQVVDFDERARKAAKTLLPGALTMILPLKKDTDRAFFNHLETAAIRIPDEPAVLKLIEKAGRPLFVSSANVSGFPPALNTEEAIAALPNADGIVEGTCANQMASTIADFTQKEIKILRSGPIEYDTVINAVINGKNPAKNI